MQAAQATGAVDNRPALFTSLTAECAEVPLHVQGHLPSWLSGTLLRNGPAQFDAPGAPVRHWFDGAAMLHAFTIADGAVSYRNRMLDTRARRLAADRGRLGLREFATDPCQTLFGRIMAFFNPNATDNANINVARFGGDHVALTESALPIVFDPATLHSTGVFAIDDRRRLGRRYTTAHPIGTRDGRILSHMTRFGRRSVYEVFELDPASSRRRVIARVAVRRPAYMHSFAATPSRIVLTEYPFTVDPIELLLGKGTFIDAHRWQPRDGTRFIVIDRSNGRVRYFETDAMFGFHHVNAFDDGDDLVVDLIAYADPAIIESLYLDKLRGAGAVAAPLSTVRRYRLSPALSRVTLEREGGLRLELPQIDPRSAGQSHAAIYGVSLPDLTQRSFPHAVARYDTRRDDTAIWTQADCFAGEPVFVPRPDGAADAGLLLSVVLDAAAGHSFLLVLDAASLAEVARATVPHAIPAGLHGAFFAAPQR